jgi:hypothetical protein
MIKKFAESATPEGYKNLLNHFSLLGYRNASFHDFCAAQADLLLRHDVDVSLEFALQIAKIEYDAGYKSTFFILIASEFYNPASAAARDIIKKIMAMGHEIGLHFDASVYRKDLAVLNAAAQQECIILENIIGAAVKITAFHRPGTCYPEFLGMDMFFANRLHAYAPQFFSENLYVSDGAGYWSHGHPLDHPAVQNKTGLQLLTHPYLWVQSGNPAQKLDVFLEKRSAFLEKEAIRNFKFYGDK